MSYNLRSWKSLKDNDVNSRVVDVLDKEKGKGQNVAKKRGRPKKINVMAANLENNVNLDDYSS